MIDSTGRRSLATTADADTRQQLLDMAAQADAEEGIRQGLEDARHGRKRLAYEFLDEFEAMHGLRL